MRLTLFDILNAGSRLYQTVSVNATAPKFCYSVVESNGNIGSENKSSEVPEFSWE